MFLGTTSTYSSRSVDSRAFFSKFTMVGYPYMVPDLEFFLEYPRDSSQLGRSKVLLFEPTKPANLMDFLHIKRKIFYLRQNISESVITFPK